jgi:hypothetical protein
MLSFKVVGPSGSLANVAVAMSYWQNASQRMSWQVAAVMAAYRCILDDSGAGPFVVCFSVSGAMAVAACDS